MNSSLSLELSYAVRLQPMVSSMYQPLMSRTVLANGGYLG